MSLRQRLTPSTLLRIAMACLLIEIVLPRIAHPASASGTDWVDGVRGVMLGLALGFIYLFFNTRRPSAVK